MILFRLPIHLFIFSELGPGAIRKITIRDDTAFTETIEVKRFWQFPKFDGSSYYDIAVIELGITSSLIF